MLALTSNLFLYFSIDGITTTPLNMHRVHWLFTSSDPPFAFSVFLGDFDRPVLPLTSCAIERQCLSGYHQPFFILLAERYAARSSSFLCRIGGGVW
jgi:hypothetical protein